ncbi:hypothetical protein F2P81_010794 [Scophthalmus maximus]|uniref:Uncharacterized protein n=1 Tax=Scophthalmus maximus TaxID=52904 RepID=A0A6A4T1L6_SCOMX|nr:hypothetical protein F2P81_010794 [Scophthalmus maximus]
MAGTVRLVVNGGAVVRASEEQQSTIDETRGGSLVSLLQASVEERVAAGFNRYTGVLVCILGNTQVRPNHGWEHSFCCQSIEVPNRSVKKHNVPKKHNLCCDRSFSSASAFWVRAFLLLLVKVITCCHRSVVEDAAGTSHLQGGQRSDLQGSQDVAPVGFQDTKGLFELQVDKQQECDADASEVAVRIERAHRLLTAKQKENTDPPANDYYIYIYIRFLDYQVKDEEEAVRLQRVVGQGSWITATGQREKRR